MKILAIGHAELGNALRPGIELQWQDIEVLTATNAAAGLRKFFQESPDMVLLGAGMRQTDAFDVLEQIRRVSDVPLLLLTPRTDEIYQVRGLELGADDCVTGPFTPPRLLARIRAILRRAGMCTPVNRAADFEAGDVAMHFQNRELTVAAEAIKLTRVEYTLLYHLVCNAGQLMSAEVLLEGVFRLGYSPTPDQLKVYIHRLRRKLYRPGGPGYIETERGRGYRFVHPRHLAPAA
jgi:DNA-binding response OmpR family regulator